MKVGNWPLVFARSSVPFLNGHRYTFVRFCLFVTIFFLLICTIINDSGFASRRILCADDDTDLATCASSLNISVGAICGAAQREDLEYEACGGWSVWECVCPGPIWLGNCIRHFLSS